MGEPPQPQPRAPRLDQAMAAQAARILPDTGTDVEAAKTLRTRMRQLPLRLRSTGFVAAFAFIHSKSGDTTAVARAYRDLRDLLIRRIAEEELLEGLTPHTTPAEFLRALSEADATAYARITTEADMVAGWLSRIADARYQAARPANATGTGGAGEGAEDAPSQEQA
ncbi:type III-B CRISPR module-associated protein Cmr5 [Nocardiopsis suaedae]|uniref:CRISPR type III-B/RAMP module-associated protein Cmr5 n=1 Tax=Nocardiopsis suaedae TaxID=3018444 RepID=A0ABT4TL55_9ACTN|nr:type III-B CRISPR module-associated protein Cmr5 [Nocardiopsis suaedae]MDA2805410.1 type III-B CRISPR module-associated protein Cmr5 [Nocardiopsis suaedae]